MGLSYHFKFKAPATATADELELFLRSVEDVAKQMGFRPTTVLNAVFDTTERKRFSRRLTTGLPVEDPRLKGADLPDDSRVWHLDTTGGTYRVPPDHGVVLVVTDEQERETLMGFFRFPEKVHDVKGRVVAEAGLKGAWYFRDSVRSPDPRFRSLVQNFAHASYLESERDEFLGR